MFFLCSETKLNYRQPFNGCLHNVCMCTFIPCYSYRRQRSFFKQAGGETITCLTARLKSRSFNSTPLRLLPSRFPVLVSTVVAVRLPARLRGRVFVVFARHYSTQCVGKTLLQCLFGNSSRQISHIEQTSNQRS